MVWFQFLYKCVLFTISYGWLLSKYLANHGITSRKIINEVIVPEWCCASIYHRRRCYLIFQQRVQFKATPASNWKLCFINLVANKYHMIHSVVMRTTMLCKSKNKIPYELHGYDESFFQVGGIVESRFWISITFENCGLNGWKLLHLQTKTFEGARRGSYKRWYVMCKE